MCVATGFIVLAVVTSFVGAGSDPLARRLWRACRGITTRNERRGITTRKKQEESA